MGLLEQNCVLGEQVGSTWMTQDEMEGGQDERKKVGLGSSGLQGRNVGAVGWLVCVSTKALKGEAELSLHYICEQH